MTWDIVIPAGGVIDADFASAIGGPYRALAPLGPEGKPVLQHVVDTLRASGVAAKLICVAPDAARAAVGGVDVWLPAGDSGPENTRLGLSRADPHRPALLCASDLPWIDAGSVRAFAEACLPSAAVSVGLVRAGDFTRRFPDAPPSEFVSLSDAGPVTLAGLFQVQPELLTRRAALFGKLFSARKAQWRMAGLLGPRLLWQFATRSLSLRAITGRAEHLLGGPVQVIRDIDPHLAYDIDALDDYTYAQARFGQR